MSSHEKKEAGVTIREIREAESGRSSMPLTYAVMENDTDTCRVEINFSIWYINVETAHGLYFCLFLWLEGRVTVVYCAGLLLPAVRTDHPGDVHFSQNPCHPSPIPHPCVLQWSAPDTNFRSLSRARSNQKYFLVIAFEPHY